MPSIKELACWEIMGCDDSLNCPARQDPHRPCWSIAKEIFDYRTGFDICRDCIVYVVKNDLLVLSAHDIDEIRGDSTSCTCSLSSNLN